MNSRATLADLHKRHISAERTLPVPLLFWTVQPNRRVGTFGRMSCFSKPELFETALLRNSVFYRAGIGDRFDLPIFDKRRPQRNDNKRRAYQHNGGQNDDSRRDGDKLLRSAICSSRSRTDRVRHCHCFVRFPSSSEIVAANGVSPRDPNQRHGLPPGFIRVKTLTIGFDKCAQHRQWQAFVVAFSHVVDLGGKVDMF